MSNNTEREAPVPDTAGAASKEDNVVALPGVEPTREPRDDPAADPAVPAPDGQAAPEARAPVDVPTGLEERIRAEDAAFHQAHLQGLALAWGNLWIGLAVGALGAAAFSAAMAEPLLALGAGAALGFAVYAFIASVVGLRISFEHERKVAEIHKTARLGAERLRIDDPDLVRGALRDVLSEWMHSALLLRRLKETSFWYRWAVIAQLGATLALIIGFALLSPLDGAATALLVAAALALTALHGYRQITGSRERGAACALGADLDPTDRLADRVVLLLEEVRTLRRHGRET